MEGTKKTYLFIIILLLYSAVNVTAADFDHSLFDELLHNNVNDGLVDYQSIKGKDSVLLLDYLELLMNVEPDKFETWGENEKLAFWINAYNAITLYAIVDNYPIQYGGLPARVRFPQNSIRQIKKVWDTVHIKVMGRELTLNNIEHEILRKEFQDPRIHFAIVCASIGCPRLLDRAFFPDTLDDQLDAVTRDFITDDIYVSVNPQRGEVTVSSIFDWYKEDFTTQNPDDWVQNYGRKERGFVEFITFYLQDIPEKLDSIHTLKLKIKYFDYDWSLNEWNKQ